MSEGYIYVLANASMPDVVKVGKTVRQPSLRAQELSGVTGVPTPFMVVYERFVADCDSAEQFVHTFLERKGYRVNQNREFFSAPVAEAINAVLQVPERSIAGDSHTNFDDLLADAEPDELTDLRIRTSPWSHIWEEAEAYRIGKEDHIQDEAEALRLYKEAARLNCAPAYRILGNIYEYGRGTPRNSELALRYYKEGVKRGDYGAYLDMSHFFLSKDHIENAEKCLLYYFRDRETRRDEIIDAMELPITYRLAILLRFYLVRVKQVSEKVKYNVLEEADDLLEALDYFIDLEKRNGDEENEAGFRNTKKWVEHLAAL